MEASGPGIFLVERFTNPRTPEDRRHCCGSFGTQTRFAKVERVTEGTEVTNTAMENRHT